jgi:hypothetical protein
VTAPRNGAADRNRAIVRRYESGAAIGTIANQFGISNPTVLKIIGREQLAQLHTGQRLTPIAYDGLVERWNDKTPDQRRTAARQCKTQRHDYVETPTDGIYVCCRCLKYDHDRSNR